MKAATAHCGCTCGQPCPRAIALWRDWHAAWDHARATGTRHDWRRADEARDRYDQHKRLAREVA